MRYWIIIAIIMLAICPALAMDADLIQKDPTTPLKGTILLKNPTQLTAKGWVTAGLANGPDLDLGYNDYLDVRLRLTKDSAGPVEIGYGTTHTQGLDKSRRIEIPANILVRDGAWHVYRLDLGLEKLWRGNLTDLAVIASSANKTKAACELGQVIVGDFGAEGYTANYNGFPKTEYELSSKHFRFIWNEARAKAGMNPKWAHDCLRNIEECWQLYVKLFGMNEPGDKDAAGLRYRINFSCIENGYFAGGPMLNIDPSGLIVDPPTWVIPHEFRHVMQSFSRAEGRGPEDMYEADANYTRECWLWHFGPTFAPTGPTTTVEYTRLLNFGIPSSRTYYICWPLMVYMNENPDKLPGLGGQIWWRVWGASKSGETMWDTIQRLAPEASLKDILGHYASRRNFNYTHRLPNDISERTELRRCPDSPDWWQVPSEMAPMQAGFVIHELVPEGAGTNRTVTVEFQGVPDRERGNDWRASLVVVADNGTERCSKLWNAGKQSVTLAADENRVILVVAGTPDKMIRAGFDDEKFPYRSAPGKSRMPYQVRIVGARPKESAPEIKVEYKTHPNGGGKVANTAQVDATAYVGQNAIVSGTAKVLGNARIEDFAMVDGSSQVLDNAVVSGHARVMGTSVIKDHAKIRDYAEVRNSTVSGYARVLEHAQVRDKADLKDYATAKGRSESWGTNGSYIGGDGVVDGDFCGGETVTNGFQYGHQPFRGNVWVDKRKAPERVVGGYDFARSSESLAYDRYGSSDGLLRGKPEWIAQDSGRSGVLKLTGKDYVVLNRQLVDWPEFTIAAWVRWDGGAANQPVWFFGAGKDQCMWLTPDDGNGHVKFTATLGGVEQSIMATSTLPKGKWVHVAVTGQGIYVDGALVAKGDITIRPEQVLPANVNTAAAHVYLGRGAEATQPFFQGVIDEVNFYSKSMSAAEVAAMSARLGE